MANTYRFRINSVDTYTSKTIGETDLADVVYNVHWSYIGEDENSNSAHIIGVASVSDPNPSNFVSFDELTQSQVIAWIEPTFELSQMQANLDKQISEIVAPTTRNRQIPPDDVATEEAAV